MACGQWFLMPGDSRFSSLKIHSPQRLRLMITVVTPTGSRVCRPDPKALSNLPVPEVATPRSPIGASAKEDRQRRGRQGSQLEPGRAGGHRWVMRHTTHVLPPGSACPRTPRDRCVHRNYADAAARRRRGRPSDHRRFKLDMPGRLKNWVARAPLTVTSHSRDRQRQLE